MLYQLQDNIKLLGVTAKSTEHRRTSSDSPLATSKSDSFLFRHEKSNTSLDTIDTESQDSNSGLGASSGESMPAVKEQGSEDSLICNTTNNLTVNDVANGEAKTLVKKTTDVI